ncbi:unnamed protein product, partial [Timema podura]|nr:unnamed protein product [Timema podura]
YEKLTCEPSATVLGLPGHLVGAQQQLLEPVPLLAAQQSLPTNQQGALPR